MPVDCVTGSMWPSNLREHEIKGLSRRWRHRIPGRRRLHDPRRQPAWRKYFDPRSGAHHGRKPGRRRRPRGRVFHARRTHVDNYECTWDLYKSIPSLNNEGKTVFDETVEFNERHKSNAMARLVDSGRAKGPVTSMGFSMAERIELLKLSHAGEDALAASCITDWLSPGFFETEFWYMWSTTFAFQPWHSAVEFRRYLQPLPARVFPHRNSCGRQANPLQPVRLSGSALADVARGPRRPSGRGLQGDRPRSQDRRRQVHRDRHPLPAAGQKRSDCRE